MIRTFLIATILTGSSAAFAVRDPDIAGKWTSPCTMHNPQETEFAIGVDEFKADGTGVWTTDVFNNLQCSGAPTNTLTEASLTYETNNNEIEILLTNSAGMQATFKAHYEIVGDELRLTDIVMSMNGKTYKSEGEILKRKI